MNTNFWISKIHLITFAGILNATHHCSYLLPSSVCEDQTGNRKAYCLKHFSLVYWGLSLIWDLFWMKTQSEELAYCHLPKCWLSSCRRTLTYCWCCCCCCFCLGTSMLWADFSRKKRQNEGETRFQSCSAHAIWFPCCVQLLKLGDGVGTCPSELSLWGPGILFLCFLQYLFSLTHFTLQNCHSTLKEKLNTIQEMQKL